MDIILQIEDTIERNGSDFELSKVFKQYIKEYKDSLPTLFEKNQGKDFLVKHTRELDKIIALMYKTVLRRIFGIYVPMSTSVPITIVALGSYGREQLCVHSDIDLMIVFAKCEGYNTELIIEKFLYLAWDAGLKLGHRVHELKDLKKASSEDVTIKTAMMESRYITGSTFTWQGVQKELNKARLTDQKEFLLAKIDEATARRKKYPTSMQPNIKESIGGLRDSQLLFWIAKTIYDVQNLKDLCGIIFSDEEYNEYRVSLELLFRVRSALHLVNNKQEDRLSLGQMPQISQMLGFKNEKIMATKIFNALWRINNFSQIFVKKMVRTYLVDMNHYTKIKESRIEKGIYVMDARLYASYHLTPQPIEKLLDLLLSLPDQHYRYDSGFLNLFTYSIIKHPFRTKVYTQLRELFKRSNSYCFLKLFYDAGLLHQLIISFRKVMFLPQFDGYHHYPVDIHSIKCIQALESIKEPFIQSIYDNLSVEEKLLLKVAVLIHDTGKGRRQDHSEIGSKIIIQFAKQLKFKDDMIERASLLIRHHVLMSSVALRENIHNEETLYKFLSNIKDEKNLKLLYVLTYADINGVGKGVYTSYSAKLLKELYLGALEVVKQSDRISDASKRLVIEKKIKNSELFATLSTIEQKKVLSVESNLFYFKHTPDEIIKIAKQAKQTIQYSYSVTNTTRLSIEIYRRVPLNISYLLASLSYLDVGSMDIFTLFDGIKYFKIEFSENIEDDTKEQIEQIIEDSFDMSKTIHINKPLIKREEISIDCDHSQAYAQLSINTKNQRGLLAYIMDIFEKNSVEIATAKVDSTKTRARDNFLIEKQNNLCDNAEIIFKSLSEG
jgi:[protein-PII] uridylyltransferase